MFRISSLNVNISQHREFSYPTVLNKSPGLDTHWANTNRPWDYWHWASLKLRWGPFHPNQSAHEWEEGLPLQTCWWLWAVKEIRMLLILIITPHKVFSVQCPENHASDNPGPGHPKNVQMTPILSPVWGQKKEEWKGRHEESYTTQSQVNWKNNILWTNRKRAKGNMLSIKDDLRMMEFCTSVNVLICMFCI